MTYDASFTGTLCWGGGSCPGGNTCDDSNGDVDDVVCASNRNSIVQLFAPGALITSTSYNLGYEVMGGTSMATPHVAGAFAVINQYLVLNGSSMTPSEIESLFNSTGEQIYDSVSGLYFSRIDLYSALNSIVDVIPPNMNLLTPSSGIATNNNSITINFTATDDIDSILACDVYINSVLNNSFNVSNGSYANYSAYYPEGSYTWYVNISEIRTFSVDRTAPLFVDRINDPMMYRNDSDYILNVTVVGDNTSAVIISLYNGTWNNFSMQNSGTNYYFASSATFQIASNTLYNYYFWGNDSLNNINYTVASNFTVIGTSASQTIANTPNVNIGDDYDEIIVPENSVLENVTVNSTGDVYLNLSSIISNDSVTIPNNFTLIREAVVNYTAYIPSGTEVQGPSGWNGTINLPIVRNSSDYTAPSGDVEVVVDMGSSIRLNFSQAVKLIIGNMSGKSAAWTNGAGTLSAISTTCTSVTVPGISSGECSIDSGSDLLIWTYHFTEFAAYSPASGGDTSSGGGGGGGSSSSVTVMNVTDAVGHVVDGKAGRTYSFYIGKDKKTIRVHKIVSGSVVFIAESPKAFFTLAPGQDISVDFDNDKVYDINVELLSLIDSKYADFKVYIGGREQKRELVAFTNPLETEEPVQIEGDIDDTLNVSSGEVVKQPRNINTDLIMGIVITVIIFILVLVMMLVIYLARKNSNEIEIEERLD